METLVGYGRVSTKDQSLEIQQEALKEYGCTKLFLEQKSGGALSDRVELEKALEYVREGDTLVVFKLDRLARSIVDLHNILSRLDEKGVKFKSIKDSSVDTASAHGKLMMNILGSFAEFERELIRERQALGIAKAKKKGKYNGRKKSLSEGRIKQLRDRFKNKAEDESAQDIAREFGISRASLYRYVS
ncbi:recombinase family protein [Kangiella japonica]|uniref:Recombinase family protein n=1 Tax=Kangiella japonica TaxID=647384 RepID=A0ABN0SWT1_9GAMM